jgi:hypothetical protein
MSIEMTLAGQVNREKIVNNGKKAVEFKKNSPFEYPECNGHPGSSSYNWVLTDYLGYRLAKLLGVTDGDAKK